MDENGKLLIDDVLTAKIPSTIYFGKFNLNADDIDLAVYRLINYELQFDLDVVGKKKTIQYIMLLMNWFNALNNLKKKEINADFVPPESQLLYFKFFEKVTEGFTTEQKIETLYRIPFHLKEMVSYSHKYSLNLSFISNIASVDKLDTINSVHYFELGDVDLLAMDVIEDDIRLGQENALNFLFTKNLHTLAYYMLDRSRIQWNEKKKPICEKKDLHAVYTCAYMVNKCREEKDLVTNLFIATAHICFWHYVLNKVDYAWMKREGKFQKLKRHVKKS